MSLKSINTIDLVMLSNFDKSAGGMETWAYGFIPHLLNKNNHIFLQTYGLTPSYEDHKGDELFNTLNDSAHSRLKMSFFKVLWPNIPWFFSMLYQFRKHLKKSKYSSPDMVLCVGGLFEIICMFYSGEYKKTKKVLWMRTIFFNEKAKKIPRILLPFGRWLEAKLLKRIDVLLANGSDIAEHYSQYGLKVHVIRNAVDIKKWQVNEPLMENPLSVAFIGRLADAKGIEEFLLAIKKIKCQKHAKDFKFIVVGNGPYSNQVIQMQANNYLKYLGVVDNKILPELMKDIDICVALTKADMFGGGGGTSNALLEQMASGRVIVAWDNVIFRQILDEESAYLCEQNNVEALINCLYKINNNKEKSKLKAIKSKEISKGFSNDTQLSKFESLIEGNFIEK